MKHELHITDVSYVTDVTSSRLGDLILLGRIAQVRIGSHVGLATAIRARLNPEELNRVGLRTRKAIEDPNKFLEGVFREVASSPERFARLPVEFAGSLRFGNISVREAEARVSAATLASPEALGKFKLKISHQLAEEFRRDFDQHHGRASPRTRKPGREPAGTAATRPAKQADPPEALPSLKLLECVFPATAVGS